MVTTFCWASASSTWRTPVSVRSTSPEYGSPRSARKEHSGSSTPRTWPRVSARSRTPSSASVTSAVAVTGVTRLIRTATSKAIFCTASRRASGSSPWPPGPRASAHRERLGEADVYRADPGELPPGVGRQPAQPLRLLLRRPALLGRHRRYLAELVVGDGHRHQAGVAGPAARDRLGDVGQQAVARRAQLAGPRAAALHVPLEVEALGQQVAEVLAQRQLVDLVVAGAAPDEDEPGPPGQQADRPDAEVVAADYVVAGEIMLGEDVGEQQRVRVRAVAGQEDQRVAAVQLPQPGEPGGVGLDVPRVGVQRAQRPVEQVDRDRAHGGDQAVQGRPGRSAVSGSVRPSRAASAATSARYSGLSPIASATSFGTL